MQADSVIFQHLGYGGDTMPAGRPAKHDRTPFGTRLHAARVQAGLSQSQIAEALDITQPSYADWERRSVALKPDYLPKLAALLGVSVDYLVGAGTIKKSEPASRARKVFEEVLKLPRKQQVKVVEMAEGFLSLHGKAS